MEEATLKRERQSVAASARRIVIANNPSFNTAPPQHDQQQFQYHHHQQQQQQHQPQFQTQYNTYTDPICHNYHNVTLLDLELHWM